MKDNYAAPTLADIKKVFGSNVVYSIVKVKQSSCQDAKKYIAKLERIYKETKKAVIQFD